MHLWYFRAWIHGIYEINKYFSEFDEVSPELHTVVQSTLCGAFVGVCFGGFVSSREAYLYFIENNQATAYKTVGDAKVL